MPSVPRMRKTSSAPPGCGWMRPPGSAAAIQDARGARLFPRGRLVFRFLFLRVARLVHGDLVIALAPGGESAGAREGRRVAVGQLALLLEPGGLLRLVAGARCLGEHGQCGEARQHGEGDGAGTAEDGRHGVAPFGNGRLGMAAVMQDAARTDLFLGSQEKEERTWPDSHSAPRTAGRKSAIPSTDMASEGLRSMAPRRSSTIQR